MVTRGQNEGLIPRTGTRRVCMSACSTNVELPTGNRSRRQQVTLDTRQDSAYPSIQYLSQPGSSIQQVKLRATNKGTTRVFLE